MNEGDETRYMGEGALSACEAHFQGDSTSMNGVAEARHLMEGGQYMGRPTNVLKDTQVEACRVRELLGVLPR